MEKDINNSFSKEHIQKINSAKNIKSEESSSKQTPQHSKGSNNVSITNKPPRSNNSGVNLKKDEAPRAKKGDDQKKQKGTRSTSVKKNIGSASKNSQNSSSNNPNTSVSSTNNPPSSKKEEIIQEIDIEEEIREQKKKKARDDVNAMKRTMKSADKEYFAFQEKVTNILE